MDWKKAESKLNFIDRLAGDKVVWIIVLFLCLISLVSIFSSTSQLATETKNRIFIIKEHLLTVSAGLLVIIVCYKAGSLKLFKWFSKLGFWVSLILLTILDLHMSVGPLSAASINGAWRIIKVGGFQIHVFEIVKIAMVMYLAWAVDAYRRHEFRLTDTLATMDHFHFLAEDKWQKMANIYIPLLIILVMSLPGGNSNAMFLGALMFLTILIAGLPIKDIIPMGLAAVLLLGTCVGIYYVSDGKYFDRIGTLVSGSRFNNDYEQMFIDSERGTKEYQDALDKIRQPVGAKLAIKSGGLIGKGPGNSSQKYIVPVIYEDYIFSFLIEEYGLLFGGILVIFLYISLLARGSIIARNCDDDFGKCAVAGLSVMITAQAMMHILVNCDVGLLTGQTLPLISYGTSSFLCFSLAFGIILSISRLTKKQVEREVMRTDPIIDLTEERPVDDVKDRMEELDSIDI